MTHDPSQVPISPGAQPHSLANVLPVSPKPQTPSWVLPLVVGLVVVATAIGGVAAWSLTRDATPTPLGQTTEAPTTAAEVAAPLPPPPVTRPPLAAKDIVLTVKILEKTCFGSAGCNVAYVIQVEYTGGFLEQDKIWDVTYQVDGGDDPQINTFTLTGTLTGYTTSIQRQERISTPSSSAKLTASVTTVSAH